jgi:hypothetical protein
MAETVAAQFTRLLTAALSDRPGNQTKPKEQQQRDYESLHHFVVTLTSPSSLDTCIDEYLRQYRKYPPEDPRSKQIFVVLLERRIKQSISGDAYPEDLHARLRDSKRPLSPLYVRFQSLGSADQAEINKLLQEVRLDGTILDELRQAYSKAHDKKAKSFDELYVFCPNPDPALKKQLRARVKECDIAWSATQNFTPENWEKFKAAFQNYGDFIRQNAASTLTLFQILKWIWDPFRKIARGAQRHSTPAGFLDIEYYLRIVVALYIRGANARTGNLRGLTTEEYRFFFEPLAGTYYEQDYKNRFAYGTHNLGNVPGFYDLTLWHLQSLRIARSKNVSLASATDVGRILSLYQTVGELADSAPAPKTVKGRSFRTVTRIAVAKREFHVGDTIGVGSGELRILYFEGEETGKPQIYVEFLNLPHVVFLMDINEFSSRVEALVRLIVWRDNKDLPYLIEKFMSFAIDFLVPEFGFVSIFIERGIGGVLVEVAKQKLFDMALEAVSRTAAELGAGKTIGALAAIGVLTKGGKAARLGFIKRYAAALKREERLFLSKSQQHFLEEVEKRGGRLSTRELGDLGLHPQVDDRSTAEKLMESMADKDRRVLERETERRLEREAGVRNKNWDAMTDPYVANVQEASRTEEQAQMELAAEAQTQLLRDGRFPPEKGWGAKFPRTASNEAGTAQTLAVAQKGLGTLEHREITIQVPRRVAWILGIKKEVRFDGFASYGGRYYVFLEHKEVMTIWEKSGFSRSDAIPKFVEMMERHGKLLEELTKAPNSWWKGVMYSGGGDPRLQEVLDRALIQVQEERLSKDTGKLLFSAGS